MLASPIESRAGGVRTSPPLSENTDFLLETIVCDVHWTALEIGTLTMLLSSARSGEDSGLHSGRHLLHDDSKTMLLALRYAAQIGLAADIVTKLVKTYRQVGEAKRTLAPLLEGARPGHAPHGGLQGHCDAWRRIAGDAAATVAQLQRETGARLSAPYAVDADALRQFLEHAAKGGADKVGSSGVLATPRLQQRRRAPRLAVARVCTLLLPNGPTAARLEDVSQRGLGVGCEAPLADRQRLTILLEDGRRLEATVVRRQGSHIGLQLESPLPATDPLLLAAVQRK